MIGVDFDGDALIALSDLRRDLGTGEGKEKRV